MQGILYALGILLILAGLSIPFIMVRYLLVVPTTLDHIENELSRIADAAEEKNKIERRKIAILQDEKNKNNIS